MKIDNSLVPKDGIEGLKENWKADIISGFMVFLITLPLSLGIAKASGFPTLSGIFSAIIGGLLVSLFSGARLTIKGPAAGLIIIALGAVTELGYKQALATIVIAGLIQIIFGLLKMGKLGDFFPSSAVHGLLAAIGIIITLKQIHILLGVRPISTQPLGLLAEIPNSILHLNPVITFIGCISLLILFLLPEINIPQVKKVPPALIVLMIAIPLSYIFHLSELHKYYFGSKSFNIIPQEVLVVLDKSLIESISFPDFSGILRLDSFKYIVMFSLIGSIESLLSAKAIDSLDPYKRKSNLNKDLLAVGIGNTISGMIGGLPMISEIVRSSSNINNGGKTRWANFFHGLFLLLFVSLTASFILLIPSTALAAMLIFTGYRLTSPREFYKTYKIGSDQLVIFVTTVLVTLATGLLLGIAAGILAKFVLHLAAGVKLKWLFISNADISKNGESGYTVNIKSAAIFSNFIALKKKLEKIPNGKNLSFDFSETLVIDHTFMDHLYVFEEDYRRSGGTVENKGLDFHRPVSDHPLATLKMPKIRYNNVTLDPLTFNPRQKRLRTFSQQRNMAFDPRMVNNVTKYKDFLFSKGKRIEYAENVIKGKFFNCSINIADTMIEEIKGIRQEYKMTLLLITDINITMPDYRLMDESFINLAIEELGLNKINFQKSSLSPQYLIEGDDDYEVKIFVEGELLQFFERYTTFNIECKNNQILIYKEPSILTTEEMKTCVEFAEGLLKIIQSKSLNA